MFRRLLLIIALWLVPISAAAFTANDLANLGERDVVKFGTRKFVQADKISNCGEYFFLARPCSNDNDMVVVRIKIGLTDPSDLLPYFFFRADQIRIVIDNRLKSPRATIHFNGLQVIGATIKLSEADLRVAPCLPQPTR